VIHFAHRKIFPKEIHVNNFKSLLKCKIMIFLMGFGLSALAQDYPIRPITLIVPFAAGGAIDQMARSVGQALGRELGQSIVVDNRPGAGGNIGAALVARAEPNGYTLLVGTSATHGVNPTLFRKISFDARNDFIPVSELGYVPNVLVVREDAPWKSVGDIVADAKKNPDKLTFGSAGNGTSLHLAGELFKEAAKVNLMHVAYKGGAPASLDLLAGNISMMFDTISVSLPNIRSHKTRALAVAAKSRHFALPDTPTFAELGYPSVVSETWAGVFAPAKTPPDIVARIDQSLKKALQDQKVVEIMRNAGVQIEYKGARDFSSFVDGEIKFWGAVVRKNNLEVD